MFVTSLPPFVGLNVQVAPRTHRLAYIVSSYLDAHDGLWVADADGRHAHRITEMAPTGTASVRTFSSSWSPDGRFLAAAVGVHRRARIRIFSAGGTLVRDITPPGPAQAYGGLKWSPRGDRLAFVRYRGTYLEDVRLFVMRTDGAELRQVFVAHQADKDVPAATWSPDGSALAITTQGFDRRDPQMAIYDLVTSNLRVVHAKALTEWSPDSRLIAGRRPYGIESRTRRGRLVRKIILPNSPYRTGQDVAWLPDGRLALNTDEEGAVFALAPDGHARSRVVHLPARWAILDLVAPR